MMFCGTAFALTDTVTTISSSSLNHSSSYGTSVTFTAKVTPNTATGTVTFKDGAATLGTGTLSGGTATYNTPALTLGTHSNITAVYSGNASYAASTSLAITQTVTTLTVPPLTFAARVDYGAGDYPYSVATGDFNGDGVLDLAAVNYEGNNVSVLLGNGNGTFAAKVDYGVGIYPFSVAAGDFNGDGKLDLSTANWGDNTVSVLLGNGDGTFAAKVDYDAEPNTLSVAAGDFNGDGKLDLVTANLNSNSLSVLLGNGDGTFSAKVDYGAGSSPFSVAAGDFNGDGVLDLATANDANNTVSVLLGNGDGTFAAKVDYGVGSIPYSVVPGDFNGDGKLDLATANRGSNNVSILLGNGDGTFAAKVDYPTASLPDSVAAGDFNGDGNLDLAAANYGSNNVSVLPGNGDGTFAAKVDYGVGTFPRSVIVGDFNGDGKPDLVAANYASKNVSVLLGSSICQTVTIVASSFNPSGFGSSITFTATVTPSAATGTVTFKDGATTLGTGTLSGGTATFATSTLSVGDHSITAEYGGDTDDAVSTSTEITQTVVAKYYLSITPSTGGTVLADPDKTATYYLDSDSVQLTANPLPGYEFTNWGGDASGNTNPLGITMDGNKTLTANFTKLLLYISDISPGTVGGGSIVTLHGVGFGVKGGALYVGPAKVKTASWSDTTIIFIAKTVGSFPVHVVTSTGSTSNSVQLNVLAPAISGITPDHVAGGTSVALSGAYFGNAKGRVYTGLTKLKVLSWTDSSISFIAPSKVLAGSYPVHVVSKTGGVSNDISLDLMAPVMTDCTPSSGAVGSIATLTGQYFGTKPSVNLTPAAGKAIRASIATGSTNTSINFIVPKAPLGSYSLKVNNAQGSSNTFSFTVF